ncbi:GNAT family N-acetyltransferase [Arthrobacter sp. 35W]|uniref:GNAT family N-acetyltransferase n=1 Tax=Arthrobacter sp. 35W TaxID=1132441 RepID=UPI0004289D4F|nr:N-acetyltransferase [Arthrobacter sp. 35W]
MIIRNETPADRPRILELVAEAFATDEVPADEVVEVPLLQQLFDCADYLPGLSLVAELDGRVDGHVICTRGWIGDVPALGLGPLAVTPEAQRDGVGSALMESVIAAAEAAGEPAIVLLGHTGYYPRFGFVPASSLGIEAPDAAWGGHFMALPLAAFHSGIRGPFRYAEPFNNL